MPADLENMCHSCGFICAYSNRIKVNQLESMMLINWKVFVFFITIFSLSMKRADLKFCESETELENKCGMYAHRIVKPLLRYFESIHVQLEDKDKKIDESKHTILEIEKILKEKEQEINDLKKEILNYKETSAASQAKEAEIQVELDRVKSQMVRCSKITELESSIQALTIALEQKDLELTNVTSALQEYNQLKLERDTLKTKIADFTEHLNEKQQHILSLITNKKTCEMNQAALLHRTSDYQKNLAHKDFELRNLQDQLDKVNYHMKHLTPNCEHYQHYTGLLTLKIEGLEPFTVSCDAGWTVIQRRIDGKTNFYRAWDEYKSGFGDAQREFWLGLEKMHLITSMKRHELYIQMKDQNNKERFARYSNFAVAGEGENYKLISVGEYSGNAGNSLLSHVGNSFSTYDRDNDKYRANCAKDVKSAWWFFFCGDSNLNAKRFDCNVEDSNTLENTGCIFWQTWHGRSHSLTFVEMKIRPAESDKGHV